MSGLGPDPWEGVELGTNRPQPAASPYPEGSRQLSARTPADVIKQADDLGLTLITVITQNHEDYRYWAWAAPTDKDQS